MIKIFFHVDMDAFYASIEQLDFPEYKGKPVIVGAAPGGRGVVSACSYEARKYGVHSAMPISTAVKKCPNGVFRPVRMHRYIEVSQGIMRVFRDFTPSVHQISVDEAFLDMTGTERLWGKPVEAAKKLKTRIKTTFGLNVSIGIAENKYLAKLASDYDKPDGLFEVTDKNRISFLDSLALKDLWGLGKKTLPILESYGITSVKQLREMSKEQLSAFLGKGGAEYLYHACRGSYPGMFMEQPKSHSMSSERTFGEDITDRETLQSVLLHLSHLVMNRLIESNNISSTVQVKLRESDFSTTTAQKTLPHPVQAAEEIYHISLELLNKRWNGKTPLRLIGVGLSSVTKSGGGQQAELFEEPYAKNSSVEKAVHAISRKIDGISITKASLLKRKEKK